MSVYVGKNAAEVVFEALLDNRARSGDLVGTAILVVERLVEWGYPLKYDYAADTHAPKR
jgi:hypothetical protein